MTEPGLPNWSEARAKLISTSTAVSTVEKLGFVLYKKILSETSPETAIPCHQVS